MEIISRVEARKRGLKRFFTGKDCPNGHAAPERLVSNGTCVECTRDKADRWASTVSGTIKKCKYGHNSARSTNGACLECERLDAARVRAVDPEKARAGDRRYYARNAESRRASRRDYARRNRAKETAANRAWVANNPEKVKTQNVRRAAKQRERRASDPEYCERRRIEAAEWQRGNPDKARAKGRRSYRKRSETIEFRLQYSVRNAVSHALRYGKKFTKSLEVVGCTIEQLRTFIEGQFRDGMSWSNWGKVDLPGGWELDHRRAIGLHRLTKLDEFRAAFHYLNLQPLLIQEHRKKSKIDHAMVRAMKRRNRSSA